MRHRLYPLDTSMVQIISFGAWISSPGEFRLALAAATALAAAAMLAA